MRWAVPLSLALTAACAPAAPAAAGPDPGFHIRLERGMCFGSCPAYSVDVDAAGHVLFVGGKSAVEPSVPCQGERRWTIGTAAVARLQALVDSSGYFGFRDSYAGRITDMPTFTVTVTRRGRTKAVRDYVGLAVGMPRAMVELENAIDEAAGTRDCVVGAARAP